MLLASSGLCAAGIGGSVSEPTAVRSGDSHCAGLIAQVYAPASSAEPPAMRPTCATERGLASASTAVCTRGCVLYVRTAGRTGARAFMRTIDGAQRDGARASRLNSSARMCGTCVSGMMVASGTAHAACTAAGCGRMRAADVIGTCAQPLAPRVAVARQASGMAGAEEGLEPAVAPHAAPASLVQAEEGGNEPQKRSRDEEPEAAAEEEADADVHAKRRRPDAESGAAQPRVSLALWLLSLIHI